MRRAFLPPAVALESCSPAFSERMRWFCRASDEPSKARARSCPLWIGSLMRRLRSAPLLLSGVTPRSRGPRADLPRVWAASRLAGARSYGPAPPRPAPRDVRGSPGRPEPGGAVGARPVRVKGPRWEAARGRAVSVFLPRGSCLAVPLRWQRHAVMFTQSSRLRFLASVLPRGSPRSGT